MIGNVMVRPDRTESILAVCFVIALTVSVTAALRGSTWTTVQFAALAAVAAWGIRRQRVADRILRSNDRSKARASVIRSFVGLDVIALLGGVGAIVLAIQASGGRQVFYAVLAVGLFISGLVMIFYTVRLFTRPFPDLPANDPGRADDT
jgi:hypothetical protein